MKKLYILTALITMLLALGCMGPSLQKGDLDFKTYSPTSAVVLPLKLPVGMVFEEKALSESILNGVAASGVFNTVVAPSSVKKRAAADPDMKAAVAEYVSQAALGQTPEAGLAASIASAFGAETIITVDVTRFGYIVTPTQNYAEAAMTVTITDGATGALVWRASHTMYDWGGTGKAALPGLGRKLSDYLFSFVPMRKEG